MSEQAIVKQDGALIAFGDDEELEDWERDLAEQAKEASTTEKDETRLKFFKTRGGVLKLDGEAMADNSVAAIVLAKQHVRTYREGDFDPDTIEPPRCFAMSSSGKPTTPHPSVKDVYGSFPDTDNCATCRFAQRASADKGQGPACKPSRLLGLLPAGTIDKAGNFLPFQTLQEYESAELAYISIPQTSIGQWANHVTKLEATVRRPPHSVVTKIKLVRHEDFNFIAKFEYLGKLNKALNTVAEARRREAEAVIDSPIPLTKPAEGGQETSTEGQSKSKTPRKKKYT